jgi:hypothetical protein
MTMAVSLKARTAMSPRVIDSIFESPDFRSARMSTFFIGTGQASKQPRAPHVPDGPPLRLSALVTTSRAAGRRPLSGPSPRDQGKGFRVTSRMKLVPM